MNSMTDISRAGFRVRVLRRSLILGGLLLAALTAYASFSVFLTMPDYSEEALTWCGSCWGSSQCSALLIVESEATILRVQLKYFLNSLRRLTRSKLNSDCRL